MIRAWRSPESFSSRPAWDYPPRHSRRRRRRGRPWGILFLLGASRTGAPASAKTPGQKPKAGTAASHQTEGRIVDVKQKLFPVKDGTMLVRMGGGKAVSIPDKVARPSKPLDGMVLRVTSEQKNERKLGRPVELTDRAQPKHN